MAEKKNSSENIMVHKAKFYTNPSPALYCSSVVLLLPFGQA